VPRVRLGTPAAGRRDSDDSYGCRGYECRKDARHQLPKTFRMLLYESILACSPWSPPFIAREMVVMSPWSASRLRSPYPLPWFQNHPAVLNPTLGSFATSSG
jgi:hypothetical protein